MGQAGMYFTYAALQHGTPGGLGDNPIETEAVWQGGLVGSTKSMMGPGTVLGDYMAKHGISGPMLSGTTNFSKMRDQIVNQYGDGLNGLEAMKNAFGLSTISQAAALIDMR